MKNYPACKELKEKDSTLCTYREKRKEISLSDI